MCFNKRRTVSYVNIYSPFRAYGLSEEKVK
jgi:hypothetical protein